MEVLDWTMATCQLQLLNASLSSVTFFVETDFLGWDTRSPPFTLYLQPQSRTSASAMADWAVAVIVVVVVVSSALLVTLSCLWQRRRAAASAGNKQRSEELHRELGQLEASGAVQLQPRGAASRDTGRW